MSASVQPYHRSSPINCKGASPPKGQNSAETRAVDGHKVVAVMLHANEHGAKTCVLN